MLTAAASILQAKPEALDIRNGIVVDADTGARLGPDEPGLLEALDTAVERRGVTSNDPEPGLGRGVEVGRQRPLGEHHALRVGRRSAGELQDRQPLVVDGRRYPCGRVTGEQVAHRDHRRGGRAEDQPQRLGIGRARGVLTTEEVPRVPRLVAAPATIDYAPRGATTGAAELVLPAGPPGALMLLDLWAREPGGVYADQTWMASIGEPSARAAELWDVVRTARDAALDLLRAGLGAGEPVAGAEADAASRGVIDAAGYGDRIVGRTGHSIDRFGLHASLVRGVRAAGFEVRLHEGAGAGGF